jgi:hypothetical protein
MITRTNNPCESYNGLFHTTGRSIPLLEWVRITAEESVYWEKELRDIREGRRLRPEREEMDVIPPIPAEYIAFREQQLAEDA